VLAQDDTPDVPLRTTDVYLGRLVTREAAARGVEEPALVDSLLAEAWKSRAAWEPQIRLLDRMGTAFGTFSPRSLGEIAERERELDALTRQMSTYAETWKTAQAGVQETLLRRFLSEHPDWEVRLQPAALKGLGVEERAAQLGELLPKLMDHARRQTEPWAKLEGFRTRTARAAEARWRLEVRRAALQRMRTVLVGIAGRVLAERDPARR
jgi:hypothetical protein